MSDEATNSSMDANAYQDQARETATFLATVDATDTCPECGHYYVSKKHAYTYKVFYTMLGMFGEMGEVAEKVKKHLRSGGDMRALKGNTELAKELGDVTWYHAVLSWLMGWDWVAVLTMNLLKLRSRKDRGKLHGDGDNR